VINPAGPFALVRLPITVVAGRLRGHEHCRAEAVFELGDALLCAPAVPSLPHLGLAPVCRRLGQRLRRPVPRPGRPRAAADLLTSHLEDAGPLEFAVDVTIWPRCYPECSPERGYYHPSRHSAGQPIIAGWLRGDSWTAPVDAAHSPVI
jgi:hypothetical protein